MSKSEPYLQNTAVYHPRNPFTSSLYQLLNNHFQQFKLSYQQEFSAKYGFYRSVVSEVVHAYFECGDLKKGFARIRCPDCHHEFLLAFSCRGRWFCPSCHAKKVVQFGEVLRENILYPLPHRQYVFSIPIILRKYFLYNRKLLSNLCRCAADSLKVFLRTVIGRKDGVVGAVLAIQTFGDYAKWHPHIHSLVADGLFLPSRTFHVMPRSSMKPLAEIFRANVLRMLKKEGLIDEDFIKMILKWRHTSGFSVDNSVRIKKGDSKGLTALAQYIIRSPFSLSKLRYHEDSGMVTYHSKMSHGKNKKNFVVINAEEFIAAITQHIPEKNFQLVRYYGWYSNRMRGDRKKEEQQVPELGKQNDIEVIDISSYKPKRIPSPTWRECIKKIWEVDPLECPKCQAEMKIISFIIKKKVVNKILVHCDSGMSLPGSGLRPPAKTRVTIIV